MERPNEIVIVLDFGGQYNQLIARRVRDLGVYSELLPFNTPIEKIKNESKRGLSSLGDLPVCMQKIHRWQMNGFMI